MFPKLVAEAGSRVGSTLHRGGMTVRALDRIHLASHLPTLIVWGDNDAIIPVGHAHVAHAAIPGSRLAILEGVGHFPHVEAPDRFLDVLVEFLESTVAGGREPAAT